LVCAVLWDLNHCFVLRVSNSQKLLMSLMHRVLAMAFRLGILSEIKRFSKSFVTRVIVVVLLCLILNVSLLRICIDHFARCKQHVSRSTSCFSFLTLHKSWYKIQPTEHININQKVKQTSLRCFLYM